MSLFSIKRGMMLGLLAFTLACAGGTNSLLEQARFLLDQCNPTSETSLDNCTNAAAKMDTLQESDPDNLEAASLESSAYIGLAGIDFLQVASRLAGLQDDDTDNFIEFRTLVNEIELDNGREIDLADLLLAQTVLSGLLDTATAGEENQEAFFQLGIIQAVDSFIRPVKIAGIGAINVGNIDDDVATVVAGDLVDGDNNLDNGGVDDADILSAVREYYCRCSLNGGLDAACLRDLMRCSLSSTASPEQDYDGSGANSRGDCTTLLDPAGLSDCSNEDTT